MCCGPEWPLHWPCLEPVCENGLLRLDGIYQRIVMVKTGFVDWAWESPGSLSGAGRLPAVQWTGHPSRASNGVVEKYLGINFGRACHCAPRFRAEGVRSVVSRWAYSS